MLDANHICMIASQFNDKVIPGEFAKTGRDLESSKFAENQIILYPGSRPAVRDLGGMTNGETISTGKGG